MSEEKIEVVTVPGKISASALQEALKQLPSINAGYFGDIKIIVPKANPSVVRCTTAPVVGVAIVELHFRYDNNLRDWILQ